MRRIVGQPQDVRQPVARIRHLALGQIHAAWSRFESARAPLQVDRDAAYLLRDFGIARLVEGGQRGTKARSASPASSARDIALTHEAYSLNSCAGVVIGFHAAARAARILSIFSFSVAAVKGLMT